MLDVAVAGAGVADAVDVIVEAHVLQAEDAPHLAHVEVARGQRLSFDLFDG